MIGFTDEGHREWVLETLSGRRGGLVEGELVGELLDRLLPLVLDAGFPGGDRRRALEWIAGLSTREASE